MSRGKEIAEERLAKGEIDAKEFERIISALDKRNPPGFHADSKKESSHLASDQSGAEPSRMNVENNYSRQWQSIKSFYKYFQIALIAYGFINFKALAFYAFPDSDSELDKAFQYLSGSESTVLIDGLIAFSGLFLSVLVLVWIYRLTNNLYALNVKDLSISPNWSVGWFFIPVAWFWKPFQAVSQIVKASKNPQSWKPERSGIMVVLWWLSFWFSFFLVLQVQVLLADGRPFNEILRLATSIQLASVAIEIFSWLCILIVLDQASEKLSKRAGVEYRKIAH